MTGRWRSFAEYLLPPAFIGLIAIILYYSNPSFYGQSFIHELSRSTTQCLRPAVFAVGIFLSLFCVRLFSPFKDFSKFDRKSKVNALVALLFTMGFANIIFGFITSFIGILMFFVVGEVIIVTSAIAQKKAPSFSPRLFIATALFFVIFSGITILWSPHVEHSLAYYCRTIWVAIIPLLFLAYPPEKKVINLFAAMALFVSYVFILLLFAIYIQAILTTPGNHILAFVSLNKCYLNNGEGWMLGPIHLLGAFGIRHYTFLYFALSLPFIYLLTNEKKVARVSFYYVIFSIAILMMQSRIWMLLALPLPILATLLRHSNKKVKYAILTICAVLGILLLIAPFFTQFFSDNLRLQFMRVAANQIQGAALFTGNGIGSSEFILPQNGLENYGHFHNSFIQQLVETGLGGVFLLLGVILSYLFIAVCNKNHWVLLLMIAYIAIMNVEDFIYQTDLLLLSWTLLTLAIAPCHSPSKNRSLRKVAK